MNFDFPSKSVELELILKYCLIFIEFIILYECYASKQNNSLLANQASNYKFEQAW